MPSKAKPKAAKRPSRVVNGKPAATKPHGGGPQRRRNRDDPKSATAFYNARHCPNLLRVTL